MRKNNAFEKLSQHQRDKLQDWLETMTYRQAQKRLALPPPEGFGLEMSLSTVARFYNDVRSQSHLDHCQETFERAQSIAENFQDPQVMEDAVFKLVRERLFSAALSPLTSIQELNGLVSILMKLRKPRRDEAKLKVLVAHSVARFDPLAPLNDSASKSFLAVPQPESAATKPAGILEPAVTDGVEDVGRLP